MARLAIAALALLPLLAAAPVRADDTDPRCASYGVGFIYSESSGFCIKVSGDIRAGFVASSKSKGGLHFGDDTRANVDARKNTELGPLRLYVSPRAGNSD
jgi:hypothetical protein